MKINEDNAGLKIITDAIPVSLIKIILKYRKDSFARIKQDLQNGDFVLSCSFVGEPEKFENIIKCYYEVINNGFHAELYEHGRKSTIELFNNWSKTMKEIREEIENEDIINDLDDDDDADTLFN